MDIPNISNNDEILPLEIQEREKFYVFCFTSKGNQQLAQYGDVLYMNQKRKYSLIYINKENVENKIKELKALKFVKMIKRSQMNQLNLDFAHAFNQTNEELKTIMKKKSEIENV